MILRSGQGRIVIFLEISERYENYTDFADDCILIIVLTQS